MIVKVTSVEKRPNDLDVSNYIGYCMTFNNKQKSYCIVSYKGTHMEKMEKKSEITNCLILQYRKNKNKYQTGKVTNNNLNLSINLTGT